MPHDVKECKNPMKAMIGKKFIRRNMIGKKPRVETIEDVYTTTNSKGEVIDQKYVTSWDFEGDKIRDYEVPRSTVVLGTRVE